MRRLLITICLKTYVRLPHAWQKIAMTFAHQKMGVVTASHYMLPGMAYGMDGMTHVSATARLGFAYTRSSGGVSYQDMRSLFEASGMFDISTAFGSFPLYAEDPAMVEDRRLLTLNTPWDEAVLRAKVAMAEGKNPVVPEGAHMPPRMGSPADILDGLRKEMETVGDIVRHGGVILAGTDSPLDSVATALHLGLRAQVKYGLGTVAGATDGDAAPGEGVWSREGSGHAGARQTGGSGNCVGGSAAQHQGCGKRSICDEEWKVVLGCRVDGAVRTWGHGWGSGVRPGCAGEVISLL